VLTFALVGLFQLAERHWLSHLRARAPEKSAQ